MKGKLHELAGKLGDSLQIPKDLSYQDPVLTLTGARELYIENYKCIRQYRDTCILLLSPENQIKIQGTCLVIEYYTELEMKITGNICSVSFV